MHFFHSKHSLPSLLYFTFSFFFFFFPPDKTKCVQQTATHSINCTSHRRHPPPPAPPSSFFLHTQLSYTLLTHPTVAPDNLPPIHLWNWRGEANVAHETHIVVLDRRLEQLGKGHVCRLGRDALKKPQPSPNTRTKNKKTKKPHTTKWKFIILPTSLCQ